MGKRKAFLAASFVLLLLGITAWQCGGAERVVEPTKAPSPSPAIDIHLYDEMCADMRSLDSKRQAIRKTIEAEEDFIWRSEQTIEQGILPKEDRQKAHWLMTELDRYLDSLLYDYKFRIIWDEPEYPHLPEEIREWALESCEIHEQLANELEYFTKVGEDRRRWQTKGSVDLRITVSEYIRRALLQGRTYEELMKRYCQ